MLIFRFTVLIWDAFRTGLHALMLNMLWGFFSL